MPNWSFKGCQLIGSDGKRRIRPCGSRIVAGTNSLQYFCCNHCPNKTPCNLTATLSGIALCGADGSCFAMPATAGAKWDASALVNPFNGTFCLKRNGDGIAVTGTDFAANDCSWSTIINARLTTYNTLTDCTGAIGDAITRWSLRVARTDDSTWTATIEAMDQLGLIPFTFFAQAIEADCLTPFTADNQLTDCTTTILVTDGGTLTAAATGGTIAVTPTTSGTC